MPLPLFLLAALSALGQGAAAVGSAAGAAGSAIGSAASGVGSALGSAGSAIGPALAQIGPSIAEGATAAGNAVGPLVKGVASGNPLQAIQGGAQTLGKIGVPGAEQVGSALGKVTSSPFKLANVTEAGAPVNVSPVAPAPATPGAMPEFVQAGNLPEATSSAPQQPPPQTDMYQQIQELVQRFGGGQKEEREQRTDLNDPARYGDPNRYAAKNAGSKAVVSTLNKIPGVDLLGNVGRRLMDAYLGNPEMQRAKLRVLDETGQAKAEAAQSGSLLDLITDIWKTTAAGQQAMERQTQADEAAAGRVTTQQAGADRRVEEAQTGATTRTGMVAKQKTDADNLLLAKDIMSKWKGMTEQERFGSAKFLRSVFSDFPISETEMNGLTWTEEKMRMVSDWLGKKFGGGSKTAGQTSAPGVPPPRGAGTKAREQDELDKLLFGGGL